MRVPLKPHQVKEEGKAKVREKVKVERKVRRVAKAERANPMGRADLRESASNAENTGTRPDSAEAKAEAKEAEAKAQAQAMAQAEANASMPTSPILLLASSVGSVDRWDRVGSGWFGRSVGSAGHVGRMVSPT